MQILSAPQIKAIVEIVTEAINKMLDSLARDWAKSENNQDFIAAEALYKEYANLGKEIQALQKKQSEARYNIEAILKKYNQGWYYCNTFKDFKKTAIEKRFDKYLKENYPDYIKPSSNIIRAEVIVASLNKNFDTQILTKTLVEKYTPKKSEESSNSIS